MVSPTPSSTPHYPQTARVTWRHSSLGTTGFDSCSGRSCLDAVSGLVHLPVWVGHIYEKQPPLTKHCLVQHREDGMQAMASGPPAGVTYDNGRKTDASRGRGVTERYQAMCAGLASVVSSDVRYIDPPKGHDRSSLAVTDTATRAFSVHHPALTIPPCQHWARRGSVEEGSGKEGSGEDSPPSIGSKVHYNWGSHRPAGSR
ncbi:hypothetical protein GQ53DRAFT_32811 [Thozetella sp. PMI_491]|nr:hypothetical protein GQ53DRAFT_32811 [Thozetella sp. PMI_491]